MSNQEIIDSIVVGSTEQLFGAYGLGLTRADRVPPGNEQAVAFAGIVGFTGANLRGTLVLAATSELLTQFHKAASTDRDWTGELANQLLGRIKNQLLGCGIEIYVTTPVVIRGQHLAPVPRGELQPYRFGSGGHTLVVWFEAEIGEGVTLRPGEAAVPTEGDTFLF